MDLRLHEPTETANINVYIKREIADEGVVKEDMFYDEINIEIKEEPDDIFEGPATSLSDTEHIIEFEVRVENLVEPVNCESEINTKLNPYICDVCNKQFNNKTDILKHLRIHSEKKLQSCNKFIIKCANIERRKDTPLVLKPFSCDECNKTFSHLSNLNQHKKTHLGLKPFSCDECNKTFSRSSHLKQHINTHLYLRPYSCDMCHKKFGQSSHLNIHKKRHLGFKPFPCDECSKTFISLSSLKLHKNTHLPLKPFPCPFCDKYFSRPGSLKYHQKMHSDLTD